MKRSDLAVRLHERTGLSLQVAEKTVKALLDGMVEALGRGSRIELRDFGVFRIVKREPRIARNPKTGGRVPVDKKVVVQFRASRTMHKRLND